jgi:predicted  nucleic acid-binding Zn-ribbon protein
MLKRITCEKFKTQPLVFRKGLNVVLGSSGGSNAIGKSTFLLILDFVFGGDHYTKTAKDVFERIGHHQINIEFEFGGQSYFFFRTTNRPNAINRCDSKYKVVIKEMTVPEYRDFLFHEYKITLPNIKFNEIVERFFRIYGQGNHNEHKPLQIERESMATAVEYLMKLLDMYEDIYNLKIAEENYGIKPSKQAERSVSDITAEIGDNRAKIEGLESRREKLSRQNEEANLRALGIDHEKAAMLAGIRKELERLDSRKSRLESQLRAVRSNMPDGDGMLRKDFSALRRYFPDVDIDAFMDVENFHRKINGFLRTDIEAEIARLEPLIEDTDADIAAIEKQLTDSGIARTLSQSILTQYARVSREIDDLRKKNDELKNEIDAINRRKELEQLLFNLRRKQDESLATAEETVNSELERINAIVTDGNRPAPILALKPDKTFDFGTLADKSEGTAYKNLVVYDLSMLSMTDVPALIHDSSIVKRIEDADFEQILGLYEKSGEKDHQVFIAFDKADSYTPKTYEMLRSAAILCLSVGEELFGESWSRITEPPPEPAQAEVETEVTETPEDENSEERG